MTYKGNNCKQTTTVTGRKWSRILSNFLASSFTLIVRCGILQMSSKSQFSTVYNPYCIGTCSFIDVILIAFVLRDWGGRAVMPVRCYVFSEVPRRYFVRDSTGKVSPIELIRDTWLYLVSAGDSVELQRITMSIFSKDNHTTETADSHYYSKTRYIYPHRSKRKKR